MESRSSLKQRLTRLFRPSTLLRSSCSSTTSGSIFTSSAANSSSRSLSAATASSTADTKFVANEPVFIPHDSLYLRNPSLSFSSSSRLMLSTLDCSGCRPTKASEADVVTINGNERKKERRVRETGEFYETGKREGSTCPPASPSSPYKDHVSCDLDKIVEENENKKKNKKKKKKKKHHLFSNAYGFSDSSDDDGSEFFSSDEIIMGNEDETEAFFSSRSFSSDSSEFYRRPPSRKKKNKSKIKDKRLVQSSRRPSRRGKRTGRHGGFRPVALKEEEAGDESGAIPVTKRSSNPYVDFRDSMAEMIVERQIFGAKDLESLLHAYLSLNSPHHHAVILRAFADISQVLFCH